MALQKRMSGIPVLVDVDLRFRMMDRYEGYVQVLTLANPPIEVAGGPAASPDLAQLANDEMAEHRRAPPGPLPRLRRLAADEQPRRRARARSTAPSTISAPRGVQVFTNVNGRPLDAPEYRADLRPDGAARPADLDAPGPAGDLSRTTRARRARSSTCGGPSAGRTRPASPWGASSSPASSIATPGSKIITHHLGAMIPFCEGRVGGGLDQLGSRSDDPEDTRRAAARLRKRPIDYFRMFYGDTALFGAWHAMECGLAFFGADHVLFGTDMPFDPEGGPGFIRDTIEAMTRMRAS